MKNKTRQMRHRMFIPHIQRQGAIRTLPLILYPLRNDNVERNELTGKVYPRLMRLRSSWNE